MRPVMKILNDWAIRTKSSLQTPPEDFHYKVFKCVEINYICKNLGECVCCSVITLYGNSSEDLQVHSSLYLQGLFELSLVLGIALGPAIGGGLQEVSMYICIDVYVTATRDLYTYGVFQCVLSDWHTYKAFVLTLHLKGLSCIAINCPRGIFHSHESYGMTARRGGCPLLSHVSAGLCGCVKLDRCPIIMSFGNLWMGCTSETENHIDGHHGPSLNVLCIPWEHMGQVGQRIVLMAPLVILRDGVYKWDIEFCWRWMGPGE